MIRVITGSAPRRPQEHDRSARPREVVDGLAVYPASAYSSFHATPPGRRTSMAAIIDARAWCNNEVAYLAWKTDAKIAGCLGFMITRIHVGTGERRILPTWVAFDTQSNPDWEEQDTSVWPVQKFSWRDLTLRRSRNTLAVRPPSFTVRYEIVPVGLKAPGRQPVPPSATAPATDEHGKKRYKGTPIPLFFCGAPVQN